MSLTLRTEMVLLEAPERIRDTYYATDEWLARYTGWFGYARPSDDAITAAFWNEFARRGGTDEEFRWMVDHDLADEDDFEDLQRERLSLEATS